MDLYSECWRDCSDLSQNLRFLCLLNSVLLRVHTCCTCRRAIQALVMLLRSARHTFLTTMTANVFVHSKKSGRGRMIGQANLLNPWSRVFFWETDSRSYDHLFLRILSNHWAITLITQCSHWTYKGPLNHSPTSPPPPVAAHKCRCSVICSLSPNLAHQNSCSPIHWRRVSFSC